MNSTILPVIRNIENISWNDSIGKWVIPATMSAYKKAVKALPINTPNLQVEIHPIPYPIIQTMLNKPLRLKEVLELQDQEVNEDMLEEEGNGNDEEEFDWEAMDRWSRFIESEHYSQLLDFQREGVKRAIEKKGRLLVANEGGVGKVQEALAIASAYVTEWPVLIVCPMVLLHTWKEEIEKFFNLDDEEVCILPDARADIFKAVNKRKSKQKKTSRKKKRVEFDSDEDEDDEEEDDDGDDKPIQVQFYITSHETATRRRNQIKNAKIKMVICDGAQFMKARGNTHNKAFIELLENHSRLILLSDIASHCLPVDLFTSIKAIQPALVTTFDKFAKRYCDPKQQVIGWVYNGRSNSEELHYVLEKLIWYSPRMPEMAQQLPRNIRETVVVQVKTEDIVDTETGKELSMIEKIPLYMEMYKKTCDAKQEFFKKYLEYTIRSFRAMKIAIVWYHEEVVTSLQEVLDAKKIKYANVRKPETMAQECQDFNTTSRIVFVDMKLKGLGYSCLCAADLVIFNEIPLQKIKAKEIEHYFKSDDRINPLIIKYLIAPNTLDDLQWPLPDDLEDEK
ncbi:unnamed protein product [Rhizopus stolonifer]